MNNHNEIKELALKIIKSYPRSKNWQYYLRLKDWRKLFFNIFIKKYWIDWRLSKYSDNDISRRLRLVEFFKYFLMNFWIEKQEIHKNWKKIDILESIFYRMVIIETKKWKLELLSFYHHK